MKILKAFIKMFCRARSAVLLTMLFAMMPMSASAGGGNCRSEGPNSVKVNLQRMYWKDAASNWHHASGFGNHFSSSSIPTLSLKRSYVARVWQPSPDKVKNIVVIAAGQNSPGSGGVHNGMTGQPNNYKWGFNSGNSSQGESRENTIADNSIARQTMDRFSPEDTALVLIFDAQFGFLTSDAEKNDIKNAFRSWIYSLADDPDLLYFAGSSRGGALALRVATDLTDPVAFPKFNDTLFAIQGVDPVLRPNGEYSVSHGNKIRNPLVPDWEAHEIDIKGQFGDSAHRIDKTMIKIITTGKKVMGVAEGLLPYAFWSNGAIHSGDLDLSVLHVKDTKGNVFYEGNWVAQTHKDLGRNYCSGPGESNNQASYRTNAMMDHLDNVKARMACDANGKWTYQCDVRYGCPASDFRCSCDAGYVPSADGNTCELSCPVGQEYDPETDSCVELCSVNDNEYWNPESGLCECTAEADLASDGSCVTCGDADFNTAGGMCCPADLPNYDSSTGTCYADCGVDAYWQFGNDEEPGQCVDYCPPCEDPHWETVCNSTTQTCTRVMSCKQQCNKGDSCQTDPNKPLADICMAEAPSDSTLTATAGSSSQVGGKREKGSQEKHNVLYELNRKPWSKYVKRASRDSSLRN